MKETWNAQVKAMVANAPPVPLELKELHEKGAKIHGTTGDGVLASLRSMELITTSRKGVMLPHTKSDTNRARAASRRR